METYGDGNLHNPDCVHFDSGLCTAQSQNYCSEKGHLFSRYAKFPKNWHFLSPDTHTYECVSGGKKCQFFGKFWVSTK